jgi:hypothetical protein
MPVIGGFEVALYTGMDNKLSNMSTPVAAGVLHLPDSFMFHLVVQCDQG